MAFLSKLINFDKREIQFTIGLGLVLLPLGIYYAYQRFNQVRTKLEKASLAQNVNKRTEKWEPQFNIVTKRSLTGLEDDIEFQIYLVDNKDTPNEENQSKKLTFEIEEKQYHANPASIVPRAFVKFIETPLEDPTMSSILDSAVLGETLNLIRELDCIAFFDHGPKSGNIHVDKKAIEFYLDHQRENEEGSLFDEFFPFKQKIDKECIVATLKDKELFRFSEFGSVNHFLINNQTFYEKHSGSRKGERVFVDAIKYGLKAAIQAQGREGLVESFNVVMSKLWIMVVFRDRSSAFDRVNVNGASLLGSLTVKCPKELSLLSSKSVDNLLRDICAPEILEDVD